LKTLIHNINRHAVYTLSEQYKTAAKSFAKVDFKYLMGQWDKDWWESWDRYRI